MGNTINSQLPGITQQKSFVHQKEQDRSQTTALHDSKDTVTISYQGKYTETTSALSTEEIAEKQYDLLRNLVANMLEQQGIETTIATSDGETLDISNLSQEEAQELISDDGYFGVEQTSERIVNFAIATVGDDITKLDAIKEGINKGFEEAKETFGGWLPDICYNTYDTVMEKLDAWADQSNETSA